MTRTLQQIATQNPGNRDICDIIANMLYPISSSGIGIKHDALLHLNWSSAGHTFDTDLDIGSYNFKGDGLILSDLSVNTIVYQNISGELDSITINSTAVKKYLQQVSGGIPTFEQINHDDLTNVTANQHHNQSHLITSTSDHTSSATSGYILKADANGLPVTATNTDTDVASAVSLKHSRSHALDSTSDHSIGSLTSGYLVKNDGSKILNATNTDAQVATAVSLASGAVQNGGGCGKITESSTAPSTPSTGDLWLQV